MDLAEIFVTFTGAALIGLVLWYFFSTPAVVSAPVSATGAQQVAITVQGGYSPALIEVEAGRPVQLSFYRAEEASCSEELLLPDFNIRRSLPAFQTTTVEIVPPRPGTYEFTCGMNMLRGKLLAR